MADEGSILAFPQGNDIVLTFNVTDPGNGNVPFVLTGCALTFLRKKGKYVPDTDPSARSYSVVIDPDQVTNPGKATVSIPAADNGVPGVSWARMDVVKSGKLRTANTWVMEIGAV